MPLHPFKFVKSPKKDEDDFYTVYLVVGRESGVCYGAVYDRRGTYTYDPAGLHWGISWDREHAARLFPASKSEDPVSCLRFKSRSEAGQWLFDKKVPYEGVHLKEEKTAETEKPTVKASA